MRVLIVEDEPIVALLMEEVLEEDGHEVTGVVSAASDAERIVEQSPPDLMLVDIHLTDGETGCTFAHAAQAKWGVPTLFVTGSPAKARECDSAIGVLVKPFSPAAVSAAVAAVLAVKTGRRPDYIPPELELFT